VTFLDREDGSFALDGLPPGDLRLQAASPRTPASAIVNVHVQSGATAEVTLELLDPLPGGGRIVDRETDEPVPDAEIQVLTSAGATAGIPWGPAAPCAPDGTFELDAFALGANYVEVRAEGYAITSAKRTASEPGFLDWGDIRIARPQALEIQLAGQDRLAGRAVTDLRASILGTAIPEVSFDPDGIARFERVPPGDHMVVLTWPDASWARLQLRLESGAVWTFRHRVAGPQELELRLIDERGEVRTEPTSVLVSTGERTGIAILRSGFFPDEEGWYRFDGIDADSAQVWVFGRRGEELAKRGVDLDAGAPTRIDVRLGGDRLTVRVVDAEREPIAGVYVTLRSRDGATIFGGGETGAGGTVEILGVPSEPVVADLTQEHAGWRYGVPLDATLREHELVLEATGSLTLAIADGDERLADVVTRIETPGGVLLTRPRPTSADGIIEYRPVGAGHYRIVCRRADCWTVVVERDLAAGEHVELDVAMRRLADLELCVLDPNGVPVSGAEVTLTSVELGTDVGAWLRDGLVRGATTTRTGSSGKLRLEGLPRGEYAWSVALANGPIGGTFELSPGANARSIWLR
jgi:hypothetical protein